MAHIKQVEKATIGWIQAAIEPQAIPAPQPCRVIYRKGRRIIGSGTLPYPDAMALADLLARAGFKGEVVVVP